MASQINLVPQVLDLVLYSGDGFKAKLTCKTPPPGNAPIDITGAVKAEIRRDRLNPTDPPLASFAVGLTDAYLGVINLSLTGDQTEDLMAGTTSGMFTGVWDLEWDPAEDEPRTLCQGKVECFADVTQ